MAGITLISGSTLGSAEYVAEHLADKLNIAGYPTTLQHGPALDMLSPAGIWLIITSTHGAGDLPDNLQPLLDDLYSQQPDLSGLRYGAIGIGNSEYDLFCGAIDKLTDALGSCGAQQLGETLKIDVLEHDIPEDPAEEWLAGWQTLLQ